MEVYSLPCLKKKKKKKKKKKVTGNQFPNFKVLKVKITIVISSQTIKL